MSTAGLHIEARGSGPAVVFTHGFGRTGDTWIPQADALAGDHHVVTWDMRGHGRSEAPSGLYTREAALADLGAVVDAAMTEGGGPALLDGRPVPGRPAALGHARRDRRRRPRTPRRAAGRSDRRPRGPRSPPRRPVASDASAFICNGRLLQRNAGRRRSGARAYQTGF